MADYYASSAVSSGGTGTIGDPWPLLTALTNGSQTTGDTLWLRGGTYLGKFESTLNGGTVRSYPGEWAKIDGYYTTTLNGGINSSQTSFTLTSASNVLAGGVSEIWIDDEVITVLAKSGNNITNSIRNAEGTVGGAAAHSNGATVKLVGDQFLVSGNNTTYQGFEVTTSLPNRTVIWQKQRGQAITQYATNGNSFINLILHDCTLGFFTGSSSSNTTMYGNLVYNNGMRSMAPYGTQARGGNMYLENASGYSRVYENIVLNGATFNAQFFGVSGPYVGGDIQGSVFANSGGMVENAYPEYFPNAYIGTGAQEIPYCSVSESHFYSSNAAASANLTMGYGAGMADGDITDSYFVGSRDGIDFLPDTGSFTGNLVYSGYSAGGVRDLYVPNAGHTINNNSYYDNPVFYYGAAGHSSVYFDQWKIDSGYDAASTSTAGVPPDIAIVRPNIYEIGRAHIIVYAASDPASINVDLATTGLVDNQAYTIKNAFDYFGDDVATGTYDAGSTTISLSLTGVALDVAEPTGLGFTPATTVPLFGAFIVIPGAADASAPGTPTGLTVALRQSNSTTGSFLVSWTLGSGTETSVTLRRIVGGVTTDIPLAADTTSYTDTGQTVGLSYTYAVKASNAAGDSAWSDTVQKVLTGLTCFGAPPSVS